MVIRTLWSRSFGNVVDMKLLKILFISIAIIGFVSSTTFNYGTFVFLLPASFSFALKAAFLYWQYFAWSLLIILFFWNRRYALVPLLMLTPYSLSFGYKQFFVYNMHSDFTIYNDIAAICAVLMVLLGFSYYILCWHRRWQVKRKSG